MVQLCCFLIHQSSLIHFMVLQEVKPLKSWCQQPCPLLTYEAREQKSVGKWACYIDGKEANLKEANKVAEQLQSASISSSGGDGATLSGAASAPKEEVKRLPGGKIKKKEKQEVVIEKVTRNKRKCITTVKGLDLFGVKLSDASKKLGKKFATGASVVKGPTEKEQIDVQGDISYDIVDFITETWPDVPETAIYFIEDGKKVPAT
ncbi:hypothetical protein GH714_001278 [Hevea brasiliensis]|uniref:Translation machinery-associated protein 22 n=2 Tax=Magnoliopsida TaxID=3398 RepID=A0A6A6LNT4_HEVBR|nr:hypothetical protein GH714_001278 [Hevea brasiliensis]